ncbi:MAG: M15 family metallopeptidase [Spirochaetota bacterium]
MYTLIRIQILMAAALLYCTSPPEEPATETVHPFVRAYPHTVASVHDNRVCLKNGDCFVYDDGKQKSFKEKLTNSDIEDMLAQEYPDTFTPPPFNHDPGRFRNIPFMNAMYGASPEEVEKNLTTITWLPGISGRKLAVTTVNDVHLHLSRVSDELARLPKEYHTYIDDPAGTYVYRTIAGTETLSTHAYGIAVDINVKTSNYWLWDGQTTGTVQYKNSVPHRIVEIFEKHGFIWGGKWYHYDTMHFEYRPELLRTFDPLSDDNSPPSGSGGTDGT